MTERRSGELTGRVALVTGAARGQGRAIAVTLATRGADVIGIDLCAEVATTAYPGSTDADLHETAELVAANGAAGTRFVGRTVDVRDLPGLEAIVIEGVAQLGGLDIVAANAGIAGGASLADMAAATWQEMIDIDLTGAWNTVKVSVPHLLERGRGSIVITSSANGGIKAPPNLAHYAAAKHGLVGLMRSLANELGPQQIRINCVHPTAVATDMLLNDATYRLFRPDLTDPGIDDVIDLFSAFHSLDTPWIEAIDVAHAVAFLVSDRARYVTGISLPVDAGLSAR